MAKGFYINGKRVPAITTILNSQNGWNKGALINWAHKVGLDGQKNLYEKLNQDALAGICAHEMIQAHTEKREPDIEKFTKEAQEQAVTSYKAFLDWEKAMAPEYLDAELNVLSGQHMYGGRLDHILKIEGKLALLSIKTGKGIYEDHILQIAAEKEAYEEQTSSVVTRCIIISLNRETGDMSMKELSNTEVPFKAFLLMRKLYDLQKEMKKL